MLAMDAPPLAKPTCGGGRQVKSARDPEKNSSDPYLTFSYQFFWLD
jgi:hypothetical protein